MNDKPSVLPKILTIALALVVLLGGVVFGQIDNRLNRNERLIDQIIPILYRIEERVQNIERLIENAQK